VGRFEILLVQTSGNSRIPRQQWKEFHGVKVVYLKCIIVGVLALLAAAVLIPTIFIVVVLLIYRPNGIDMPRWHVGSPLFWLLAIIIFGAGFFWKFQKLSE
jgi:hypothetical protein